jgi:hypothetical protein
MVNCPLGPHFAGGRQQRPKRASTHLLAHAISSRSAIERRRPPPLRDRRRATIAIETLATKHSACRRCPSRSVAETALRPMATQLSHKRPWLAGWLTAMQMGAGCVKHATGVYRSQLAIRALMAPQSSDSGRSLPSFFGLRAPQGSQPTRWSARSCKKLPDCSSSPTSTDNCRRSRSAPPPTPALRPGQISPHIHIMCVCVFVHACCSRLFDRAAKQVLRPSSAESSEPTASTSLMLVHRLLCDITVKISPPHIEMCQITSKGRGGPSSQALGACFVACRRLASPSNLWPKPSWCNAKLFVSALCQLAS